MAGKTTKSWFTALAAASLLFFPAEGCPEPPSGRSWDFRDNGQLAGWNWEGIEASRIAGGTFQFLGGERAQLLFPRGLNLAAGDNPRLRIRFRTFSPRYVQVFWFPRHPVGQVPTAEVPAPYDSNFHTQWVDLSASLDWIGTIDRMGLFFGGHPGWVEIDSIEIRPFSLGAYVADQWGEFWLPRHLNLGMINSLSSPRIGRHSLISILNLLALTAAVIGFAAGWRRAPARRRRIAAVTGAVLLGLWVVYDLRETYGQFTVVREINRSYLQPPAGQKTFPALGDYYQLTALIERTIPPESQYHFYQGWPFDCRLMYSVYPRRINCDASSNIFNGRPLPYHVVYRSPEVTYEPSTRRLLYRGPDDGFYLSPPGKIIGRLGEGSFIFRED